MLNLIQFEKFNKNNVLKYYDKANTIENYSYEDLQRESFKLCLSLNNIFHSTSIENDANFHMEYNVAVMLPTHSPALIPAIVG